MNRVHQATFLMLSLLTPVAASAQDVLMPTTGYAQNLQALPPDQLDQLVAPIALYPDGLVAQILMASTYPLEVVEAGRWTQNPAHAGLQGDQLALELEQKPWDPSVKSLVPFPQVLQTLNQNIEWTEQLGNAFLSQQADVMNAVQQLRYQAEQTGALQSTPQQSVTNQGSYVVIQPTNPNVVYVPYYNPETVYGTWPYPDYPPYYFSGYSSGVGYGLGFATAVAVIGPLWAWHHWDWRDHRIDIDAHRYAALNEGSPPPRPGFWQHDPDHRHGVPYTNLGVHTQYGAAIGRPGAMQGNFRGYEPQREAGPRPVGIPSPANMSHNAHPQFPHDNVAQPQLPHPQNAQPQFEHGDYQHPQYQHQQVPTVQHAATPTLSPQVERAAPAVMRPTPQSAMQQSMHMQGAPVQHTAPVFESFSHGPDVRAQQERGAQSRQSAPPPAPHPAPAQGGGHPPGGNSDHERH